MIACSALRLGIFLAIVSAACAFMMGGMGFSSTVPTLRSSQSSLSSLSMSCRRNLKKEKRARNEAMARQYRKPVDKFGGKGGFRAAKAESANADSEWLAQIYGQHTIYRRDQVAEQGKALAARANNREEGAPRQDRRQVRDPVAA